MHRLLSHTCTCMWWGIIPANWAPIGVVPIVHLHVCALCVHAHLWNGNVTLCASHSIYHSSSQPTQKYYRLISNTIHWGWWCITTCQVPMYNTSHELDMKFARILLSLHNVNESQLYEPCCTSKCWSLQNDSVSISFHEKEFHQNHDRGETEQAPHRWYKCARNILLYVWYVRHWPYVLNHHKCKILHVLSLWYWTIEYCLPCLI